MVSFAVSYDAPHLGVLHMSVVIAGRMSDGSGRSAESVSCAFTQEEDYKWHLRGIPVV